MIENDIVVNERSKLIGSVTCKWMAIKMFSTMFHVMKRIDLLL